MSLFFQTRDVLWFLQVILNPLQVLGRSRTGGNITKLVVYGIIFVVMVRPHSQNAKEKELR